MSNSNSNNDLIKWKAGTVIYNFNDKSDYAYFLKKGEIEIISEKGTRVGFINDNEVFGESSILLGTKRTVTAKATQDSEGIKIPQEKLLKEFNKSSTLIKAILRSTCIRLTNLDNTIKKNLENEN
tara:strand:+ start:1831 stop:2205 length:375 start_codon:yes stop_codon:yes gene_type:complete